MKRRSLFLVIGAVWGAVLLLRWSSRRRSMPCPPWLTVLLENPYVNSVAGAEKLLDRMDLQPGMSLLDVGCGSGRLTIPAAHRVGPQGMVTALDVQPEMLSRVARRAQLAGLENIKLLNAGAGQGKSAAGVFDRACLVTVLGEIPDQEAALAEIHRALRPAGLLSITELIPDPHYQTQSAVRRLAAGCGFNEVAFWGNWLAFTINLRK